MDPLNSNLVEAFPLRVREDAVACISALPVASPTSNSFSVNIGADTVTIPYRIYPDPESIHSENLTRTQSELLSCLLTRHHSGFIREQNLKMIVDSRHEWVPPFVVQLVGEYVVEIVIAIRDNLDLLDPAIYRSFLVQNPAFYALTKQRIFSYWDCYHRGEQRSAYTGFQVLDAFDRLI